MKLIIKIRVFRLYQLGWIIESFPVSGALKKKMKGMKMYEDP